MSQFCVMYMMLALPLFSAMDDSPPTVKPGNGESARGEQIAEDPIVIKIGDADTDEIAMTLQRIYPRMLISPVQQSQLLVIRGNEQDTTGARRLVEEMIGSSVFPESAGIKLLHIANGRPEQIAAQLMQVFPRPRLTLAADAQRSTLLVRGREDVIRQVEELVKQIDKAPRNYSLEFTLLLATQQPVQGGTAVPQDMAKIAEELKRFGHLSLLGRLHSVATEGGKFEIEGQAFHDFTARIRGRLHDVAESGAANLELQAEVVKFRTESGNTAKVISSEKTYDLQTTLRVEPGVSIAVGVAPSGTATGESGILIVRMVNQAGPAIAADGGQ